MAGRTYKKTYTSEFDYIQDLAKTSDLYRQGVVDYYSTNQDNENLENYLYALAGTTNKTSDTFNKTDVEQ